MRADHNEVGLELRGLVDDDSGGVAVAGGGVGLDATLAKRPSEILELASASLRTPAQ
jgi:hypothetical protein